MVRAPAAKAGGPGFDPRRLPWVSLPDGSVTNVDKMKDLWQFGCYQHRYEWGEGSMVLLD